MMFGGDDAVVQTNDDATSCKRSAVRMGYWKDEYIESMMGERSPKPSRRTPEIHRGYFARVQAFDELIHQFLQALQSKNEANRLETRDSEDGSQLQCQIINLGCGFDTLFWRLQSGPFAHLLSAFVDLDLPNVTCNKVRHIRSCSRLMCALGEQVHFDQFEVHADQYHLVSADIRQLDQVRHVLFDNCHLNPDLPTLFLSECVLVYVSGAHVRDLATFCTQNFKQALLIDYCQVNVFDKFGQVMVENLHFRGCDIKDLEACRDLTTQSLRYKDTGFNNVQATTMLSIYHSCLNPVEKSRIERIEFLDESNLLDQLLAHYCIVVAYKGCEDLFDQPFGFQN